MAFRVPLSTPDVGEVEERYVLRAMQSGWVAPAGPDLDAFEGEVAKLTGRRYAVGLSSGTAALHLALVSWGVGPGDVVPVSTLTFAATVNAIRYVGATPHFVDSEPETGNINPELLDEALTTLISAGNSVPCVIPVDLLGKCVNYTQVEAVAARHGVKVLSDAAESLGASHGEVAAGRLGEAAVLSFNGNKIMTTSGGGALLTDDEALARHARKLSTQAREPVVHYEHSEIGYNYRLSNILAALGRAQLTRLDTMVARRRQWRERYRTAFANSAGVRILGGADDMRDNCWLTAIVVDNSESRWSAADLSAAMSRLGIETRPIWKPMHLQPVFAEFDGTLDGTSDGLFDRGLTLPSGSSMTDDQFDAVELVLADVVNA